MRRRNLIFAGVAGVAGAAAIVAVVAGGGDSHLRPAASLGEPAVEVISPRNGARQSSRAVVVKVRLRSFKLAPAHFGGEPQLGEGHIRFALNRVPNCVDPAKLKRAVESPIGRGRLQGASF